MSWLAAGQGHPEGISTQYDTGSRGLVSCLHAIGSQPLSRNNKQEPTEQCQASSPHGVGRTRHIAGISIISTMCVAPDGNAHASASVTCCSLTMVKRTVSASQPCKHTGKQGAQGVQHTPGTASVGAARWQVQELDRRVRQVCRQLRLHQLRGSCVRSYLEKAENGL